MSIPGWAQAPGTPHVHDPTRTWLDTDPNTPGVPPTLTAIAPAGATVGAPDLTVTATGTLFTPDAKVMLDGRELSTTFVSPTSLTATVAVPATAGAYPVTVIQSGGESGAQTFTVT